MNPINPNSRIVGNPQGRSKRRQQQGVDQNLAFLNNQSGLLGGIRESPKNRPQGVGPLQQAYNDGFFRTPQEQAARIQQGQQSIELSRNTGESRALAARLLAGGQGDQQTAPQQQPVSPLQVLFGGQVNDTLAEPTQGVPQGLIPQQQSLPQAVFQDPFQESNEQAPVASRPEVQFDEAAQSVDSALAEALNLVPQEQQAPGPAQFEDSSLAQTVFNPNIDPDLDPAIFGDQLPVDDPYHQARLAEYANNGGPQYDEVTANAADTLGMQPEQVAQYVDELEGRRGQNSALEDIFSSFGGESGAYAPNNPVDGMVGVVGGAASSLLDGLAQGSNLLFGTTFDEEGRRKAALQRALEKRVYQLHAEGWRPDQPTPAVGTIR